MFVLETVLGQILRKGPVEGYAMIRKKFTGIGWANVIISWIVSLYYAIILCWAVYYFFLSFYSPLPWAPIINQDSTQGNYTAIIFIHKFRFI
jgi:SNF family Na+-dependent transporter